MDKIAIDIGGTFMRVALFHNEQMIKMVKERTPKTKREFIKELVCLIHEVKDSQKIKGIGIGIPGPADYKKGVIINPPNLPHKRKNHEINNPGSFELLASGEAMRKKAKMLLGQPLTAKQLKDSARRGNKKAQQILEETTLYLAIGISNLIHIFNPEIIVLSGGVKEAGDYFLDKVKSKLETLNSTKTKIIWTRMDEPGLLGASTLIK